MKNKLVLIVLFLFVIDIYSQSLFQYDNLRFEKGYEFELPPSWQFPRKFLENGCRAELNSSTKIEGNLSVKITNQFENPSLTKKEKYSNLFQSIDAIPYRNKKVRFTIAILKDSLSDDSDVKIWIQTRIVKDSVNSEFIVNNEFKDKEWHYLSVETSVERNINEIRFGILFNGIGKIFIDDAKFEVIQPEGYSFDISNPIKEQHIDNFVNLAKLYAYARYFYPSLESQLVDWERFMFNLIYLAEDRKNNEYINDLNRSFKEIAPLMHIYNKNTDYKIDYPKPKNAEKDAALGYRHSGAWSQRNNSMYFTEIRNIFLPTRIREASIVQVIDVSKYKNMKIKFSANIKTAPIGPGSNAQIWLRGDDAANNMIFAITSEQNKARNTEWKKYEISQELNDEVKNLRLGLVFFGEGDVYFDDVELIATDKKGKSQKIEIRNAQFEEDEGEILTRGWVTPASVISAGYEVKLSNQGLKNSKCALISSDKKNIEYFPELGEIYYADLSNDYKVAFPLNLFYDSLGTYPKTEKIFEYSFSTKPKGYYPNPKDRTSRLLQVIQTWSAINQFSIVDLSSKADSILISSIKKAATDNTWIDFKNTLKSILKNLNDAQSRVWSADSTNEYGIPFLFEYVDNKFIISGIPDSNSIIRPGDEILEINNRNSLQLLNELANLEGASNNLFNYRKAIAEIRSGFENSELKLKIKLNSGKILDTILVRDALLNNIVENRPPVFAKFDDDIYYFDLTVIDDTKLVEFMKNIPEAKKIIFDLRGTTQMSEHFLGFFKEENFNSLNFVIPTYTKPDKKLVNQRIIEGIIEGFGKFKDAKLAFLSDERAVGYSEIILATVKENSIGTIIGRPSAGTSGEVTAIRLAGNINFTMTGMKAETKSGDSLWSVPILPDVNIKTKIEDIKTFKDPILEYALELMSK